MSKRITQVLLELAPFSLPTFSSTPYYKEPHICTCRHPIPHVQILDTCLQTAAVWLSLEPKEAHTSVQSRQERIREEAFGGPHGEGILGFKYSA